jgi:voltage-gated potassium channel
VSPTTNPPTPSVPRRAIDEERRQIAERIERWSEIPMLLLSLAWIAIVAVELIRGPSEALAATGTAIWIVFVAEFAIRFGIAPDKLRYLRSQWWSALALALPALRSLRLVRLLRIGILARTGARAARGATLLRVLTTMNRGMRALGANLERRGFAYVLALSTVVLFVGAAGIYAFESTLQGSEMRSYGTALYFTAMLLTTIGSQYWPRTPEGQLLALVLSLCALGILGYVTALLATFFVGRDAARPGGEIAGQRSLEELRAEIRRLREELRERR